VPIVQAWANGQGFSRVDFDVDLKAKRAKLVKLHQPIKLCEQEKCEYEGDAIVADPQVAKAIEPFLEQARKEKARELGVVAASELKRSYEDESPLGNLMADVIYDAASPVDVAFMNGGGIRANIPAGNVTYGHVFEVMPFDNRVAVIKTKGIDLRRWIENKLSSSKGGFLSISGVQVEVVCNEKRKASVTIKRPNGKKITDDEPVSIATTDFYASAGEDYRLPEATVTIDESEAMREKMVKYLVKKGKIANDDPSIADPKKPRFLALDGKNVRCGKREK
jgi:5'-nucleotidase